MNTELALLTPILCHDSVYRVIKRTYEHIHGEAFTDNNGRVPNAIAREKSIVPPKYVALFEMNAEGLSS